MFVLFISILPLQTIFGKYISIDSQYFWEPDNYKGKVELSISLKNADGTDDFADGVKVTFEIDPSSNFEGIIAGMWKYYTTSGTATDIIIHKNCEGVFNVIVKAPGYTSAVSNTFTKSPCVCWHTTASVSVTSACPYENFVLSTQYFDSFNVIQQSRPLLIEEFADTPIIGTTSLASSTGDDQTIIAFGSIGIKYIYSVYDSGNANSVPITILYCTESSILSMQNEETVYKIFSIQTTIQKNGQICDTCQGIITLYSLPSTILDGINLSSLESQATNGIASFTSLSVQAIGSYEFYIHSQFLENDKKIGTVNFNKAKLDVSLLTQVLHI
ncbi:hypothetical protein SteCoe_39458 [Stentor coeruleus]|uniref:GOLD domain-containing protein n=1 Tax=Stentor coeruleus TaxID=5963 RepID=A0A1R2AKW5_9CILI|nr:hypothetical protein SteCoe_39458 [Stentor coeruleus]